MEEVQVNDLLDTIDPISLKEMDGVKLLNRVDRKYIIPIGRLPEIINLLRRQYYVLEIDGHRAFNYETTYYDTPDYRFYQDHHNNRKNRLKVRSRIYTDSNLHFFEIKMKGKGRTDKYRKRVAGDRHFELTEKHYNKIRSFYPKYTVNILVETLLNSFTRTTFVNKSKTERCTIDTNISFRDPGDPHAEINVNDIAIIEVKQSRGSMLNGIAARLRTRRIHPSGISKYALGLILSHPEIKHNSFKKLLHRIDKIKLEQN